MAHITLANVEAWLATSKLPAGLTLDAELESQLSTETIAELGVQFDVSGWSDDTNTPSLVKHIIAMRYAAWYYDRTFAQDDDGDGNSYADRLRQRAANLLAQLRAGQLSVPDAIPLDSDGTGPDYFPSDASSNPTGTFLGVGGDYLGDGVPEGLSGDSSLGGPAFSLGKQW